MSTNKKVLIILKFELIFTCWHDEMKETLKLGIFLVEQLGIYTWTQHLLRSVKFRKIVTI